MNVYAIRAMKTTEFYAFTKISKTDTCVTKIVYFKNRRDAEKFASFLVHSESKNPPLYEYYDSHDCKNYKHEYSIYRLQENYFKLMLGMSGLGYHECVIENDTVFCVATGQIDIPLHIRKDVFETTYNIDT